VRNQVGSYYPERENFRLTPEVKEKFTEKLRSDPHEFMGQVIEVVGTDGLKLILTTDRGFAIGCREASRCCGYVPRHAMKLGWGS
jgi:hypothetical protein